MPKTKLHPGDEAVARGWAREYGVPLRLAREAFAEGRNYPRAMDWLHARILLDATLAEMTIPGVTETAARLEARK